MRILFITDKFVPERGGSQIIFGQTYAHLRGHDVTVVTRAWPGDREVDAAYPHRVVRVPYSNVPRLRSPMLWLTLDRVARRLARKERFDQIHCGQTVETAPLGVRLARKLGVPCVVHTFAEDVTTYLRHPFYGPMMRRGLRDATVVTSISQFTVEHLRNLGVDEARIRLLYPGVTPSAFEPTGREAEIRKRFNLEGKQVILSLNRLIPRKGQDTVLQALPKVLERAPNAAYLIVGGGPEEARLRALATQLGVNEHVRWAGSIPNTSAVDYYHACDLFVMPNREMPNGDIEGFGLVFLEANACGKPVIGGRSGGAVDAVEDGVSGYLVNPTSPDEVAGRLLELLLDGDLRVRLGAQGKQRVLREFTWNQSGERLAGIVDLAASTGAVTAG
jgi:phosphatidylinositol alpha-1,6-mannosyltransferase